MSIADAVTYVIAQIAGGIASALVLMIIATGKADYTVAVNGLGQNGWGAGYLGEYTMAAALCLKLSQHSCSSSSFSARLALAHRLQWQVSHSW